MNIRQILTPETRVRLIRWLAGNDIGIVVNTRLWWDSRGQVLNVNGKNVRLFHTANADYYVDGKALKDKPRV